jgi:hypothetical protein
MKAPSSAVKLMIAASIIIVGGMASSATVGINGTWSDKDQKNVYMFLKDNEFKFQVDAYGKPTRGEGGLAVPRWYMLAG